MSQGNQDNLIPADFSSTKVVLASVEVLKWQNKMPTLAHFPWKAGIIVILILQMRKLSFRKFK